MDDQLVTVLEDQDHGLEQPGTGVETQAQLAVGRAVLIEGLDPQRPLCRLDGILRGDTVLSALW